MTTPVSIHYQRRWFYVLWGVLLLLSAGAWVLWERPTRIDQASLVLQVRSPGAPAGTRVQVWNGPWARWKALRWASAGADGVELRPDSYVSLPLLRVQIARRRWVQGYVPRGTWDLVILKFTDPSGTDRYHALPLSEDIRRGVLRPRWRLTVCASVSWAALKAEAAAPEVMP